MTDTPKLTQQEEKSLRELEKFAEELASRRALYGAALDGLSAGIDADIAKLDGHDLDGRMARAEEEIAQMAADVVSVDTREMADFQGELDEDQAEESALLAEDEADPVQKGKELEEKGEHE